MKGRYLAENLYKSKIINSIVAISAGGNSLDEYEILCESAPKYDKGRVFVDFDNSNTSKRDLIFFHRKKDKTIYYYRKNRDLLGTGAISLKHEDGATIQMNDVSEWINSLSKNLEDFGYIEEKYDTKNDILVYGGDVDIFGTISHIDDKKLVVPTTTDGNFYVIFDYATSDFAIYSEEEAATKVGIRVGKIVIEDGEIKTVSDSRTVQLPERFSSTLFETAGGNISIKDGAIDSSMLSEAIQTALSKAHTHDNREVIDLFTIKNGKLYWGDRDMETLGENNAGENVGSGAGIYKDKYGVNLRFKSIIGSNGISVVQQGDTLNIVGGMVTETQTDTFVGNGTQTVFVASKEIYNNGLIWITTIGGTTLVYDVDYVVGADRQTITFVQAPVGRFFANYITRSDLGLQVTGETNTASNDTTQQGFGLFKEKNGVDLKFNRIKAGDNVFISQDSNGLITISSLGGGGGGNGTVGTRAINGILDGLVDGVNKVYTLPAEPISGDSVLVFKNGLLQRQVTDYAINGHDVTFVTAPETGDEVAYEMYTVITETIARNTINSEVTTIGENRETIVVSTIANTPIVGSMRIRVNGVLMLEGKDYKISNGNVYIKNVLTGDEIHIMYFYSLS